MNRRGFFGTLAALVAIPWVGSKRKPIIYPPGINVVYFDVKPLDKETEAAVEKIRQEFYQRYQGYENIPVGILRERA